MDKRAGNIRERRRRPDSRLTLLQFAVFLIADRFEPYVFGFLAWNLKGEMGEPRIISGPMPVLCVGGYVDNGSRKNLDSRFSLFLIPTAAGNLRL